MKRIAIKYGIWMFVGFTLFFLVMHVLGNSHNYNLRILNGLIHLSLIYLAINEYYRKEETESFNYMNGVVMGVAASMIGVVSFTIFMMIYLYFNTPFMHQLQETVPMGYYLNSFTAALIILMEGLAISVVGSYIVTRIVGYSLSKA